MAGTLSDAFDVQPDQWGTRGDPHVWRAMRELLVGVPVPEDDEAVRAALVAAFNEVTGADLDAETEKYLHREEFNHGGMSGGMVYLDWWRTKGVPLLIEEARR